MHCHRQTPTFALSTYLLLRILHAAHAQLASSRHAHWITVRGRRRIRLAGRVRPTPWLLWTRVRIIGHAVELRALHCHEVHGGNLRRRK